jgi:hypothetical protein
LLQLAALVALEDPNDNDLTDLQKYLATREMGPLIFCGLDKDTWGSVENPYLRAEDLVSIVKPEARDLFSKWCLVKVMKVFFACSGHRFRKPDKVSDEVYYKQETILRITYCITTIFASLLLILDIVVLWLLHSMAARLAVIASFTMILSVCLVTMTTAPRSQIFAVIAG